MNVNAREAFCDRRKLEWKIQRVALINYQFLVVHSTYARDVNNKFN